MQKYERIVRLKTIYMTLLRRTEAILITFFSLSLAAFLVTNFFIPKEYTSNSAINNAATSITENNYKSMQNQLKNDSTLETIAKNLQMNKVAHADGKPVSKAEISSGVSFSSWTSNLVQFTITFKSSEQPLAQLVLVDITNVVIDILKPTYPAVNLGLAPTEAVKTSKESTYLLIGVAASLVVALGVPFIYEIVSDQLYESSDINDMGAEGFELRASGK